MAQAGSVSAFCAHRTIDRRCLENSFFRLWLGFRRRGYHIAVDNRRAARGRVDLANESVAVVDQVAILDGQNSDAFADQCLTDAYGCSPMSMVPCLSIFNVQASSGYCQAGGLGL